MKERIAELEIELEEKRREYEKLKRFLQNMKTNLRINTNKILKTRENNY